MYLHIIVWLFSVCKTMTHNDREIALGPFMCTGYPIWPIPPTYSIHLACLVVVDSLFEHCAAKRPAGGG